MKRVTWQILALAALLLVVCVAYGWITGNRYTSYVSLPAASAGARPVNAVSDDPRRLQAESLEVRDQYARIRLRPRQMGESSVRVVNGAGTEVAEQSFRVGPFMTVYDPSTGGFTGDTVVMLAFTVFCFASAFLMIRWFFSVGWREFYSYGTIYAAGFSIFALLTGLLMAYVSVCHILHPGEYRMLNAYLEISRASWHFMVVTAPLMLVFALAMIVSNVELLRHEKPRLRNALGILAGTLIFAGEGLAWMMYGQSARPASRLLEIFRGTYATLFVYFECMLIGAIICGVKAARHRPSCDRDYIIILGCRFRKDGTLTPLLRGRVDAAIAFWREQLATTGKIALLIPSGGQGNDEAMPEAEAMRRYIVSHGVPEEAVRVEARSRNTFQNMSFSRDMIGNANARIAYVTTNYHVFRSGIWASLAGLPAEGIGSRTKWWFWPNAFMRECLGLLKNRWKQETAALAALVGFFALLSSALA